MNVRLRRHALVVAPLLLGCAFLALSPAACGHHDRAASSVGKLAVSVAGTVTSEAGLPVAGATVTVGNGTATTDASGHYAVALSSSFGTWATISVSAAGYSPRSAPVSVTGTSLGQNVTLRAIGLAQSVALPSGTDPNASASIALNANNGNNSIVLFIPANSLQFADGTAPNGNVDVTLTLWPADDSFATAPTPLMGQLSSNGNATLSDLISFGMAGITISQAGKPLQVASGHKLPLHFILEPDAAGAIASVSTSSSAAPQLWSANHNDGLWQQEGTFADGSLSFDANSSTLIAQLPHLSEWNIDGISSTNGCLKGTLVDCSGKALANQEAWIWLMGKGEIGHYDFTTGGDGTFCAPIGGIAGGSATAPVTGYFFVSFPGAPNSAICNPTGIGSLGALCGPNSGRCVVAGANENNDETKAFYYPGLQRCGIGATNFSMCGYCGAKPDGSCRGRGFNASFVAGQCTDLGRLTLNIGACGSAPSTPSTNSTTPPVDPCKSKGDMTGQACSTSPDCCNAALVCLDATCVPQDN